jgi:hypothetical protein
MRTSRNLRKIMLAIDYIAILIVLSARLTNDHETEKDRGRSTALESAT